MSTVGIVWGVKCKMKIDAPAYPEVMGPFLPCGHHDVGWAKPMNFGGVMYKKDKDKKRDKDNAKRRK